MKRKRSVLFCKKKGQPQRALQPCFEVPRYEDSRAISCAKVPQNRTGSSVEIGGVAPPHWWRGLRLQPVFALYWVGRPMDAVGYADGDKQHSSQTSTQSSITGQVKSRPLSPLVMSRDIHPTKVKLYMGSNRRVRFPITRVRFPKKQGVQRSYDP